MLMIAMRAIDMISLGCYASTQLEEKSMFSFDEIFSFLTPFSPAVWFCFLGLMIGTGSPAAEHPKRIPVL